MTAAEKDTQAATQEIIRYHVVQNKSIKAADNLAVEEPLEIIIDYPKSTTSSRERMTLAVTMRTPGHDRELAAGFLFSEGIIKNRNELQSISPDLESANSNNSIAVMLTHSLDVDPNQLHRHFFTNSSCGVCGKTSIQALEMRHQPQLHDTIPDVASSLLCQLPERLRAHQQQFSHTGGVHAAALFSPQGELLMLREDVGRHNAMDKLIGACLLEDRLSQLKESLILVSGRSSFELVQKALMADVAFLAAIGAPTSLAVQLASRHGMTLIGFLKADSFNIYHSPERVI